MATSPSIAFSFGHRAQRLAIALPEWCRDQRNQMTGPADDGELCVKMLNSGAPGVMLDLEDSCVNEWSHHETGVENILACLRGELTYYDKKRDSGR
jgi:malate synthase